MPDADLEPLDRILAFLDRIGLPAAQAPVPDDSFLPGVRVVEGVVVFDRSSLRWPADLLHEAGHVAIVPAALRSRLTDDLDAAADPSAIGEAEATAWAYAAIVELQLDPAPLFHDGGYGGHAAALVQCYQLGVYPGAHGLARVGMTRIGDDARRAGVAPYPRMTRWLRE